VKYFILNTWQVFIPFTSRLLTYGIRRNVLVPAGSCAVIGLEGQVGTTSLGKNSNSAVDGSCIHDVISILVPRRDNFLDFNFALPRQDRRQNLIL
jgi:hypothetical protein